MLFGHAWPVCCSRAAMLSRPGPSRSADASHSSLINIVLTSKVISCWEVERERTNLCSLRSPKRKQLCFRPLTCSETGTPSICPVTLGELLDLSEPKFPYPESGANKPFLREVLRLEIMYKKNQVHHRTSKKSYYYCCHCCNKNN